MSQTPLIYTQIKSAKFTVPVLDLNCLCSCSCTDISRSILEYRSQTCSSVSATNNKFGYMASYKLVLTLWQNCACILWMC